MRRLLRKLNFIKNCIKLMFYIMKLHDNDIKCILTSYNDHLMITIMDDAYKYFEAEYVTQFPIHTMDPEWLYNKIYEETNDYLHTIKKGRR